MNWARILVHISYDALRVCKRPLKIIRFERLAARESLVEFTGNRAQPVRCRARVVNQIDRYTGERLPESCWVLELELAQRVP